MTTAAAASPPKFEFLVRITLRDGSHGTHQGFYACGADAVLRALGYFEPRSVCAMRLKPQTVLNPAHPMNPRSPA